MSIGIDGTAGPQPAANGIILEGGNAATRWGVASRYWLIRPCRRSLSVHSPVWVDPPLHREVLTDALASGRSACSIEARRAPGDWSKTMTTQLLNPGTRMTSRVADEPANEQHLAPLPCVSQSMGLDAPALMPRLSALDAQILVGVVGG